MKGWMNEGVRIQLQIPGRSLSRQSQCFPWVLETREHSEDPSRGGLDGSRSALCPCAHGALHVSRAKREGGPCVFNTDRLGRTRQAVKSRVCARLELGRARGGHSRWLRGLRPGAVSSPHT